MDYFSSVKPILNKLTNYNIIDNLFVIRQYLLALEKGIGYNRLPHIENSNSVILMPNICDFLIANSLKYCTFNKGKYYLGNFKDRLRIVVELTKLEEKINKDAIDTDIWTWLHSFCFNQTKLQNSTNIIYETYRYYWIFKDEKLCKVIEDNINMKYKDFVICAFWLYSKFTQQFAFRLNHLISFPENYQGTPFSAENIQKTISIFCKTLSEHREMSRLHTKYTDEELFNYNNSPHIIYPLFEYNNNIYCISPRYLLNQLNSGIYYIANIPQNNVSGAFGKSFEKYTGEIIKHYSPSSYFISPEIPYGKDNNKTSDWIISDSENILFIECKAKRLMAKSKKQWTFDITNIDYVINNNLINDENYIKSIPDTLTKDIIILGKEIGKIYKVYNDYKSNKIAQLPYNESKTFIPIMVTIEEWYAGCPSINDCLTRIAEAYLKKKHIDISIIQKSKYKIISIDTFEIDYQIMAIEGISSFFKMEKNNILDEYKKKFHLDSHFFDKFSEELISPIGDIIAENNKYSC